MEPADILPDTLGRGDTEGNLPDTAQRVSLEVTRRLASTGYVRSNLYVLNGGAATALDSEELVEEVVDAVAPATIEATMEAIGEAITAPHPLTGDGPASPVTVSAASHNAASTRLNRIREARLKGYEGDACGDCGNFTLVRNGTCLKCDTCGSTSGCS